MKGVCYRTFEYVDHDQNMENLVLRITFSFSPGCAAQVYGDPSKCYPAEPASWEFESADRQLKGGKWVAIPATDWLYEWCQTALDAADEPTICDCVPEHH